MSNTDRHTTDDDPALLLPWYSTGRLSQEERGRVERYLEAHPEARFQLELIEDERISTVETNESLPVPSRASFDRLMAQVETESRGGVIASARAGLLAGLGAWFEGFSPQMRGAMAAAALALVVGQAATIGLMLRDTTGPVFETVAEHPGAPVAGETVLVAFAPQATAEAINALLVELDASVASGPRAGGIYVLRLSEEADPEAAIAMLQERPDVVSFAAPGE